MRAALLAALCCLGLAGCAGLSPARTGSTAPADAPAAAGRPYQETIQLNGRLSLRYQQNGRDEALHGSFNWNQTPALTRVALLSPLGQTMAVIEAAPGGATLTQANQPPQSAPDVDALVAQTLGWPLPVAGLRDWLQGYATDAAGRRVAASPANPSIVTRDGWQLDYAAWQDDPERPGASLPRRIDVRRQTAQAGEVALRIVIDGRQ